MELTKLRIEFDRILGYTNADLNNRLWSWVKKHSAKIAKLEAQTDKGGQAENMVRQKIAEADEMQKTLDILKTENERLKSDNKQIIENCFTVNEIDKIFKDALQKYINKKSNLSS